jgi:DNA-binding response OmpR family regulator
MPVMDGFELCSLLRRKYPSGLLPIIIVSTKAREEDIIEALRAGADDFVVKPYRVSSPLLTE